MALLLLTLILFSFFGVVVATRRRRRYYPPGPKGLPLVGNVWDEPRDAEAFLRISRELDAPLVYLNLMGTAVIVLNTKEATQDLFERRSAIYSDRPPFHMLRGLVGLDWSFGFAPYGASWKEHRKLAHQELKGSKSKSRYQPLQLDAARALLRDLLETPPNRFRERLRLMTGRVIMKLAYGMQVRDTDDYYLKLSEAVIHAAASAAAGAFLVDVFPLLRYAPSWVGFRKQAEVWRRDVSALPEETLQFVEVAMKDGTARDSIAVDALTEMQEMHGTVPEERRTLLRNMLGTLHGAAADSTVGTLHTFIYAMVAHPSVQKKAQRAMDAVLCQSLPDFSHKGDLPYLTAVMYEVLRWKPFAPLGLPHRLMQDDEYMGYFLPKGSVVLGNSWAILHDESVYGADTDIFRPERFLLDDGTLNSAVPKPDAAFGFGRRVCVGQEMAEDQLWITMVSILAVYDLEGVGEVGGRFMGAQHCEVEPFECKFTPRAKGALSLIQSVGDW